MFFNLFFPECWQSTLFQIFIDNWCLKTYWLLLSLPIYKRLYPKQSSACIDVLLPCFSFFTHLCKNLHSPVFVFPKKEPPAKSSFTCIFPPQKVKKKGLHTPAHSLQRNCWQSLHAPVYSLSRNCPQQELLIKSLFTCTFPWQKQLAKSSHASIFFQRNFHQQSRYSPAYSLTEAKSSLTCVYILSKNSQRSLH